MGLLNAATECVPGCEYTHNSSPQGTRWANGGMTANAGKTIAASNWQELTFTDWEDSYETPSVVAFSYLTGFVLTASSRVLHHRHS